MPPKGVSYEEKRTRLLALFHETKDVYQLKDLEKIAPKAKGIVSQSVKEVLQSLVDDGLVMNEKIGVSNYFWSFPSQQRVQTKNALLELRNEFQRLTSQAEQLSTSIETLKSQMSHSEEEVERISLMEGLDVARKGASELKDQWDALQSADPVAYHLSIQRSETCRSAANRWTDNLFTLQKYVVDKFHLEVSHFNKQFGIPEDLDYI